MKMTYYAPHQTDEAPLTAPGPRGKPLIGNLTDVRGDRLEQFLALRRVYGDVVRLTFGNRIIHLVSHPDLIKYVLQDNNHNYLKGRGLEKAKPFLGEGLLTSEGEFWRRQRRLAQPAFHRQKIAEFVPSMTDSTEGMLQDWEKEYFSGPPFNVADQMMRLTLEIVSATLFSTGLKSEEMDIVAANLPYALRETNRRINSLLGLREMLPIPANRRFQQAVQALDTIIYRIIEDRRRSGEEKPDLLGMLMSAVDEDSGEGMSDLHLRDEAMTIFLAGHETTANNLTWTFFLLSEHPEARARLHAEVDQVLQGRIPTLADLPHLVYTRQLLDESLRLYPPAWAIGRQAIQPDQIGGYAIPAGSGIIISTYVVHRHPDFWENPEGFDPFRFSPERSQDRPRYAFMPFGGGPRQCIGNNFALMESTLLLAQISQRVSLDLVPGFPVIPETSITLRPSQGVWMTARMRR